MISENIIKTKFIVDTLKYQTDILYKRLLERFYKYKRHSKTGETVKSLSYPDYSITVSGERFQIVAHITKQLRFQDMGVRKLYTKPMYSVMMGRVMARLQYGLTEEIREKITGELSQAIES